MGLFDMNRPRGLFGADPGTQDAINSYAAMPRGKQGKGGLFGSGYDGEDILNMLLRAAAIAQGEYGAGAEFGANIGARARASAEAAQAEALHQQRRMEGREDKQWEWQNKPQDPKDAYRWRSNRGDLMEIGPDGQPRKVFSDPNERMQWVPDGMGGGNWVGTPDAAPAAPVGELTPIPDEGDGSGNAIGGFRISIPRLRR